MNKIIKTMTILAVLLPLCSCDETQTSVNNSITNSNELESNMTSSSTSSSTDETQYDKIVDMGDIFVDVGDKYSLKTLLRNHPNVTIEVENEDIAYYDSSIKRIATYEVGTTALYIKENDLLQKVNITVGEIGTYSSNFAFDYAHLEDQKIVAFGDSVTAQATIGLEKTYFTLFAEHFNMICGTNYAIGGTTATYMYPGSYIEREYGNNQVAIDGCRVVKKAVDNGEIDDVGYAFIAYGHNDQYFQPPISVIDDDVYDIDTFTHAYSYKGSYRYMINKLRSANPNIKIILLNCTYSEYDKTNPTKYSNIIYGKKTYEDYRNATKEIAEEMHCRYVDPWDYMKQFFDYTTTKTYYKDSVHLTGRGHQKLVDFIISH